MASIIRSNDHVTEKLVSLTFDDGPSQWTPEIMSLLADHHAQATFFVVGHWIEQHGGDVLRRLAQAGHEIGNHTYSHRPLLELDDEEIRRELEKTNQLIGLAGVDEPKLIRPPFGLFDDRVARVAAEASFERIVLWSISPQDWRVDHSSGEIASSVGKAARPGAIILLHDGPPPQDHDSSRRGTVAAVREILGRLGGWGYRMVTVSALLGY